jgi:outer membrane protein W
MNKRGFSIFIMGFLFSLNLFALVTELGLSYGYSKKTFDPKNSYQTDSKTASVSFYFLEKLALEVGYTDSFYESQESDANSTRTVQQSTSIIDTSLMYIILDKTNMIQPYIKGGVAYIKKSQKVRYTNSSVIPLADSNGWAPSYGAGLKFFLSERFSFKISYDVWVTPLTDGTKTDDSSLKAGLSWYL